MGFGRAVPKFSSDELEYLGGRRGVVGVWALLENLPASREDIPLFYGYSNVNVGPL